MMMKGLRPIADAKSRVLILGTFPGRCSLAARQYYADPSNQFWKIMALVYNDSGFCGEDGSLPKEVYMMRKHRLMRHRIALWDVLAKCEREGSSDRSIQRDTPKTNDLRRFLSKYQTIRKILFNGGKAHKFFRRHSSDDLRMSALVPEDPILPSSSRQYAGMDVREKAKRWRILLQDC